MFLYFTKAILDTQNYELQFSIYDQIETCDFYFFAKLTFIGILQIFPI